MWRMKFDHLLGGGNEIWTVPCDSDAACGCVGWSVSHVSHRQRLDSSAAAIRGHFVCCALFHGDKSGVDFPSDGAGLKLTRLALPPSLDACPE
jgi:hypothetical protein